MGFLDRFKRRRRTFSANFSSYRNPRLSTRKPFEPKGDARPRSQTVLARAFRIFKILALIACSLALLYALFFSKLFEVQKISVQGDSNTTEEQAALNSSLQEYLGKNLLTLSVNQIGTELLKDYPYLKTLSVSRSFFHTLTVTLKTYESAANIRMEYEDGNQQFFVVNEEGYIAGIGMSDETLPTVVMNVTSTDAILPQENPDEESSSTEENTETEGDPTTEESPTKTAYALNQELIPKDTLEKLLQTAKDFTGKFNMQILEIRYLKQARELHLLTERHFSVWLDLTQDLNLQLTKLKKSLTTLNIYEANLDYIDLRISGQNGEKVIYRLNE